MTRNSDIESKRARAQALFTFGGTLFIVGAAGQLCLTLLGAQQLDEIDQALAGYVIMALAYCGGAWLTVKFNPLIAAGTNGLNWVIRGIRFGSAR